MTPFDGERSTGLAACILIDGVFSMTELGSLCYVPKAVFRPFPVILDETPDIFVGLSLFGFLLYASLSCLATAAISSGLSFLSTANAPHRMVSILLTKVELLQLTSLFVL